MEDFDANAFLASLVISSVGFVLFVYGKRQSRFPQMLSGITMMAYPYFVTNVFLMLGIGVLLSALLWLALRLGW